VSAVVHNVVCLSTLIATHWAKSDRATRFSGFTACLSVCTRVRVPQVCGVNQARGHLLPCCIDLNRPGLSSDHLAGAAWWQLLETLLLARRGRLSSSSLELLQSGRECWSAKQQGSEAVQRFRNIDSKERFGILYFSHGSSDKQRDIDSRYYDRNEGLTFIKPSSAQTLANPPPKDMSRPTSQHRLSVGSNASSLPVRSSYSRTHSHTFSAGSSGPTHRINRRKSSTFSPAANASALAAVEHAVAAGSLPVNRRSSVSKAALASLNDGDYTPMPSSLPHHVSLPDDSSAVVDGPALSSFQGVDKSKNRARRASDGTRLTKKEKAASGELKCEHCGKAYKHGSCLNKHL
jgi:hypothetical protein